jgi:hypothetical protein
MKKHFNFLLKVRGRARAVPMPASRFSSVVCSGVLVGESGASSPRCAAFAASRDVFKVLKFDLEPVAGPASAITCRSVPTAVKIRSLIADRAGGRIAAIERGDAKQAVARYIPRPRGGS